MAIHVGLDKCYVVHSVFICKQILQRKKACSESSLCQSRNNSRFCPGTSIAALSFLALVKRLLKSSANRAIILCWTRGEP
jgi:hypothetical protein